MTRRVFATRRGFDVKDVLWSSGVVSLFESWTSCYRDNVVGWWSASMQSSHFLVEIAAIGEGYAILT
jgi:hypothetical protein